ncbi:receptor-like protein 12 [Quercus suber]|uniref:Receptor-like protein 12 n=1 Tax=Quercus suber TaxID=58331 RepID=A0AAW0L380_QUESU
MDDAQSQFEHLQFGKIEVMGYYYQDVITNKKCTLGPRSSPPPFQETHLNSKEIHLNFINVELGFIFGFGIVIWPLMFWKRWSRWSTSDCNNQIEDAFFLCYLRKISRAILDDEDEVQPVLNHIHAILDDEDEVQPVLNHIHPTMKIPFFSWLYLITICSLFANFGIFVVSDQCLHDQRDLLIGMKNSLKFNSTLSTKLVHWNKSQNCCLWKGVTCSEKGRVIGLNLFNESISGSLHNSSLFSLQYLENLNLACNKLSSSLIPSQFGNLTNLIYLNLSNAGFEGQIPIEISQLTRLDLPQLNLGIKYRRRRASINQRDLLIGMKNSLKFNSTLSTKLVHWNESQNCCLWKGVTCSEKGRVIGLNLFNESISGSLHNSSLFSLQYLENLNLACNKLSSSLIPSQFGNLTNLIYLNLSNAGFEGQIPIEISQLTRLVTLDLSTSSLLSVSMLKIENPDLAKLVWNFSELKELYLDGVNISAPGNEWCQALSSSMQI